MNWIAAETALERLQVRPQTLYAYVSRGRLKAHADPADPRRSLYSAADIAALIERRMRGRKRADVAAGAIAWGEPMLGLCDHQCDGRSAFLSRAGRSAAGRVREL